MLRLVLAVSALLLPTGASAADQFDLICKGDSETIRYRVDLARGEWCWESCFATWKIASVTSTRITFKDDDTPSGQAFNWVDRVTGKWMQGVIDEHGSIVNNGTCEPATFTGFGEEKAKF